MVALQKSHFYVGKQFSFGTLVYSSDCANKDCDGLSCIFISRTKRGFSLKAYQYITKGLGSRTLKARRVDSALNLSSGEDLYFGLTRFRAALGVDLKLIDLVSPLSKIEGEPGKILLDAILRIEGVF